MTLLITYFLKLSISLAIVYLFYHLLLRRLTFYHSNRWYLFGYTILSFFIAFINITPVLDKGALRSAGLVEIIPAVEQYIGGDRIAGVSPPVSLFADWNFWTWLSLVLIAGAIVFFLRFVVRFISFFRLKRRAQRVPVDSLSVYQVNEDIIPFSFGNSVFINPSLHSAEELEKIIRHEFVHVKQLHTLDIIWGECLCIVNWYNPFAWLLKRAMRQNLEFIADQNLLQHGMDRQQYQYLLLKVIGNNHFSIAPKFNFSSLKKRIAMMNTLQSARIHMVKFLFIFPLLAVILISFRQRHQEQGDVAIQENVAILSLPGDTVPELGQVNRKGYIIMVRENKEKHTVIIHDRDGREVERVLLTAWNDRKKFYEEKYGKLPPPPPPPFPAVAPGAPLPPGGEDEPGMKEFLARNPDVKSIGRVYNNRRENLVVEAHVFKNDGSVEKYNLKDETDLATLTRKYGTFPLPHVAPVPPVPPVPAEMPDFVQRIVRNDDQVDIWLKDGTKESYNLRSPEQEKAFEKKYGSMMPAPPSAPALPPVPPRSAAGVTTPAAGNLALLCDEFEITDKKAVMHLKTGKTEEYDLTSGKERRAFEKKFGKIVGTPELAAGHVAPVAIVKHASGQTVIAPMSPAIATGGDHTMAIDPTGHVITGEEDVLVTITKKTTAAELESFKKQMLEKGVTLKFDAVEYEKGKLVTISGSMKSNQGHSNFSATDFSRVVLAMVKDSNDRVYFKVSVTDNKVVI